MKIRSCFFSELLLTKTNPLWKTNCNHVLIRNTYKSSQIVFPVISDISCKLHENSFIHLFCDIANRQKTKQPTNQQRRKHDLRRSMEVIIYKLCLGYGIQSLVIIHMKHIKKHAKRIRLHGGERKVSIAEIYDQPQIRQYVKDVLHCQVGVTKR